MSKGIRVVIGVVGVLAIIGLRVATRGESKQQVIDRTAKEIRAKLPQKLDEYTTWVDVQSGPNRIIYKYDITGVEDAVLTSAAGSLRKEIINQLHKEASTKKLLNMGITFQYQYFNKKKKKLVDFSVSGKDM